MIKFNMNRQLRFSIIVIIIGVTLFFSTIFFPWISFKDMGNGGEEFHLNYDMMEQSSFPEIKHIANRVNSINVLFMFVVVLGLFSVMAATYYIALITSKLGFYMLIFSNIMIILTTMLIVYEYFSVIFYINDVSMISLSSPFPYFSYTFISLIGSVVFLIISVIYGGYLSTYIMLIYREQKHEMKKYSGLHIFNYKADDKELEIDKCRQENISGIYSVTEKNDELPIFSGDNPEELEVKKTDEFDEEDEEFIIEESEDENIEEEIDEKVIKREKEKKVRVPFSFDKPVEKINNPLVNKKEKIKQKSPVPFSFDDNKEKSTSPFKSDKNEEMVKDQEKQIGFEKLSQNLQNKKSLEIIEQGRREAQVDMQNDINLNPQQSDDISFNDRSQKKDDISSSKSQISIDLNKKTISVMCPKCNSIFSATKSIGKTSIKCPVCGKEGVLN